MQKLLSVLPRLCTALLLGLSVSLLGSCSSIFPHSRTPESDFISAVQPVSPDSIDPDRPFEESRYLPRYTLNPGDNVNVAFDVRAVESQDDYKIEPGDVITLTILFHDEVNGVYNVRPDGKISLPYKGGYKIAGQTPEEAGSSIASLYSDIFRDPSVSLQLTDTGQRINDLRQIFSAGANQGQSRNYSLGPDGFLNLPIVGEYGAAGLTIAQLESIVNSQYARMAPEVSATITLLSTAGFGVFVMGEVMEPGRQAISGPITASRALAIAGGENLATADLSRCILLSLDVVSGEAMARYVDLEAVIYEGDITLDPFLGPNDVLVVPSSRITKLDRWVDQYIAKLFLFRGIGGPNFSYRLN